MPRNAITLLDLHNADPAQIAPGAVAAPAGKAAVEYVFRACDLALAGEVEAIVTAPLNKEAIHLAGSRIPAIRSCWPNAQTRSGLACSW